VNVRRAVWATLLSFLVASWSTAQESPGASQTLSLAEIDSLLNNPLAKTVRIGKIPTKLPAEVHYSVVRPDSFGERGNIRLQITPVIKSPFM